MGVFKVIVGTLPVVVILSVLVWVIMYYAFPDAPLTAAETTLVVFVITMIATAVKAVQKRRKGRDGEARDESKE